MIPNEYKTLVDTYYVYFTGERYPVKVEATSPRDAMILACAERIKTGQSCRIYNVRNENEGTNRKLDQSKESPFEINWEFELGGKCHCGEEH